jgi:hypothetical protein
MAYEYDEEEQEGLDEQEELKGTEEHRRQRKERAWQRQFDRERREQFRQFLKPWHEADDDKARQIVEGWAMGVPDQYGLVLRVLEERFFKLAVELLEDEATAIEAFDKTFLELQQKFKEEFSQPTGEAQAWDGTTAGEVSDEDPQRLGNRTPRKSKARRREVPMYQGKNQFLALFRQRLEWRCGDVLRQRERHPPIPGRATWGEILGWLTEEQDEAIEDTIAADTPTPEEALEEQQRRWEDVKRFRRFQRGLSPTLRKTLKVMLQIVRAVEGPIKKREIFRRTRDILNIEPTTLTDRIHQIKLAYRKVWFGEPPDKKKPKKKSE